MWGAKKKSSLGVNDLKLVNWGSAGHGYYFTEEAN